MVTLVIEILSGPRKENRHVFSLGKAFTDDVIFGPFPSNDGSAGFDPESFYTSEENMALMPDYFDPNTRQVMPRDPKPIKAVLIKLYDHLRSDGPSQLKKLERDLSAAITLCEQAIDDGSMVEWSIDR